MDPREDVTGILRNAEQGGDAARELFPLVHGELLRLAEHHMAGERENHTLQATALVNEAFLKLLGAERSWSDRRHFFGVAAEAMRRILVDHARQAKREKRGRGWARVTLTDLDPSVTDDPDRLLSIDAALELLAQEDARCAEVVRLRFFAGLEVEEVASMLEVSRRTVLRDWKFGRARLFELLEAEGGE